MRFKYFPYGIQRGNPTWPRTGHVNKVSHEFELNKFFDFWTRFFFFCFFFCFCFCFFLVFSFSEPSRVNSVDFMNFLMPELNSRTSSRLNFSTLPIDLPKDYLYAPFGHEQKAKFCNVPSIFIFLLIGCHVSDIRSCHIYFQGQYFLYFFFLICSIFLVILFALVVFVSNAFLVIIFAAAPRISVL